LGFQIVERISDELYEEIEAFENCTLYHTRNWHRFLLRTFGWKVCAALEIDEVGRLKWLLPYVVRRRMSFKPIHVCLPVSHHVSLVGKFGDSQSLEWVSELTPAEIHSQIDLPGGLHQHHSFTTSLDIAAFPDENILRKQFHKDSIGRKIDKAEKNGLRVVRASSVTQVESFARMQTETRWRQGSPTYPRKFFQHMWEELAEKQFHLHLVYQDEMPVAGILFLHFRDIAIYGYGASVNQRTVWQLGANQLAMWAAIRDAYQSRIRYIDFGTSPLNQPELRTYKEKWGGSSQPLSYTYLGSDGGIRRDSTAAQSVSAILRQLPLPLFATLSPMLFRRVV
jgi:hypothetical protein